MTISTEQYTKPRVSTRCYSDAETGNLEIARLLITAGTRTNQQKDEGFSALHGAAGHGPHSFSRMLIEGYKENLNVRLLNSSLPIYTTAARGNPQSLQACLDAGVEIDVTNNDAMTPLHLAAASNQWVNVIFLLDKGASNDVKTDEGLSLDEERVAGGLLIGRIGMMRN